MKTGGIEGRALKERKRGQVKRNSVLKIVNPLLAVLLLCQMGSGILHGVLPRGVFEIVHEVGGLVLGGAILLHVILNWNWIRTSYRRSGTAS